MKLHESKESMELLISNISERTGVREDVLEKDYYVSLLKSKEIINGTVLFIQSRDLMVKVLPLSIVYHLFLWPSLW